MSEIVSFKEILKNEYKEFLLPSISSLEGKVFIIKDVLFVEKENGRGAIVYTDKGKYFTRSKVLLQQLELIQKYLESWKYQKYIKVGLIGRNGRNGRYLIFVAPETLETGGGEK